MRVLFAAVLFSIALLSTSAEVNDQTQDGVVFMGSSSIARWSTLQRDFADVRVVNWGAGGTGLSDAIEILPVIVHYKPRVIVLYSGENDLNAGKSPETVYSDFRVFVAKVHLALPETRIVFISMKPSPARWNKIKDKIIAANAMIKSECTKDERLRFADVYNLMLNAAGGPNTELFVEDMLHLNGAGYRIWKDVVTPLLY